MKNLELYTYLQNEQKLLKSYLQLAEKGLKHVPEGTVTLKKHNNQVQFYHRKNPTDKNGIYLPVKDKDTGLALVQKSYLQKIRQAAEKQLRIIEYFLNNYDPDVIMKIYNSTGDLRKKFINPVIAPDDVYIQDWLSTEYEHNSFAPNTMEYYTLKNERVRSKSEVSIADALTRYNIPYRYECPITINNTTIYPDFTILRIRDRSVIFWEHMGLLEDRDYRKNQYKKMRLYESAGIFTGERLITTFEAENFPLNKKIIERQIEHYCI